MKILKQMLSRLGSFRQPPANPIQETDTKLLNSMFDIAADALFVIDGRQSRFLAMKRANYWAGP